MAVSGGVDSMVLLDLVSRVASTQPIVAHFHHGIRKEADADEALVRRTARSLSLPYEVGYGRLGKSCNEAEARRARYAFLRNVKKAHKASYIITAHHRDDVLETAVINVLRGTQRRGLASLSDTPDIIRPLLRYTKQDIISYAHHHGILWHEDNTNSDTKYLRNYVRHTIMPHVNKEMLYQIIERQNALNKQIDHELIAVLSWVTIAKNPLVIDRSKFLILPHIVSKELVRELLRRHAQAIHPNRKIIEKLVQFLKVASSGKTLQLSRQYRLHVTTDEASLVNLEV